ncbi:MAG: GNAT family N-acetyltransferase [Deltaproteobacteria bacterium]|nr:GNAT family N-acetyltransferase [Deltaproteobacteria bacterium]
MEKEDVERVSLVHRQAFIRQRYSLEWIECNFRAFPRMQYFVAQEEGSVIGYIQWTERSGFREEVVLELEQLAVMPARQGNGVGRRLIKESLPLVEKTIKTRGARIKHIVVTTRADNYAQRLYHSTFGAEVEATLFQLYSADEVFMIARNVDVQSISRP